MLKHFLPMVEVSTHDGFLQRLSTVQPGLTPVLALLAFSAALLPLLASDPTSVAALQAQRQRLHQEPPQANAYYNQSLTMFGQGWDDHRYRFNKEGRLVPSWVDSCKE